jgi:hypothetical protein
MWVVRKRSFARAGIVINLHDIPSAIIVILSIEISSGAFSVGFVSSMVHPRVVSPIA